MKKFILFVLTVFLIFGLCSCDSEAAQSSENKVLEETFTLSFSNPLIVTKYQGDDNTGFQIYSNKAVTDMTDTSNIQYFVIILRDGSKIPVYNITLEEVSSDEYTYSGYTSLTSNEEYVLFDISKTSPYEVFFLVHNHTTDTGYFGWVENLTLVTAEEETIAPLTVQSSDYPNKIQTVTTYIDGDYKVVIDTMRYPRFIVINSDGTRSCMKSSVMYIYEKNTDPIPAGYTENEYQLLATVTNFRLTSTTSSLSGRILGNSWVETYAGWCDPYVVSCTKNIDGSTSEVSSMAITINHHTYTLNNPTVTSETTNYYN